MADLIAALVSGLIEALHKRQSRGARLLIAVGVLLIGAALLVVMVGAVLLVFVV